MVSFSCEACNDTVVKKKLDQHQQRCRGAYFTCIDCSTTFYGNDHKSHTSCITEAEKYEKGLYRPKKQSQQKAQQKSQPQNKEQKKEQNKQHQKLSENSSSVNDVKEKDSKTDSKSSTKNSKSSKKDSKSSKKISKSSLDAFVSEKPQNLYKVLKKMADKSTLHKDLLKKLSVLKKADGVVSVTLE